MRLVDEADERSSLIANRPIVGLTGRLTNSPFFEPRLDLTHANEMWCERGGSLVMKKWILTGQSMIVE